MLKLLLVLPFLLLATLALATDVDFGFGCDFDIGIDGVADTVVVGAGAV